MSLRDSVSASFVKTLKSKQRHTEVVDETLGVVWCVEYLSTLCLPHDSLLLLQGVLVASDGLFQELKAKINVSFPPGIFSQVSVHLSIREWTVCFIALEGTAVLKTTGLS